MSFSDRLRAAFSGLSTDASRVEDAARNKRAELGGEIRRKREQTSKREALRAVAAKARAAGDRVDLDDREVGGPDPGFAARAEEAARAPDFMGASLDPSPSNARAIEAFAAGDMMGFGAERDTDDSSADSEPLAGGVAFAMDDGDDGSDGDSGLLSDDFIAGGGER